MKIPAAFTALTLLSTILSAWSQNQPMPTKLPAGLKANLFAHPPMVSYPTFVVAAPNGDVYVSVDKNGSLDAKPDRGFICKLVDTDKDGVADKRTVFADKIDSPRGLTVMGDTVICLHPPELSAFRDKDGDGIAEERTQLIKGIGFDLSKRPPDHTSNGVTKGIDGWLYLAIGDFGFMEAEGKDGNKFQLRDGGVVRVRPDGTEMELYATGTRNIYEVAVDPWLNLFARDNNNDGGGWNSRVEFYLGDVDMGYPRRFLHFTDETFPVLGIYGGGSGIGGIYVQEKGFGWPAGYDDMLYTLDWGLNKVFRHEMTHKGAMFDIKQDVLLEIERPVNMQMDALGNAYLASWRGAQFTYKDETPGYVVRISPEKPTGKKPDLNFAAKTAAALVADLTNPDSHMLRIAAQNEILRRNQSNEFTALLESAASKGESVPGRIAALFTHKLLNKAASTPFLIKLVADDKVREFAIRALGDVPAEGKDVPTDLLVKALDDPNDHIKAQATFALARLGRKEAAAPLLSLAAKNPETPGDIKGNETIYKNTERALPHVASRALIRLKAADVCLKALDGDPALHPAALRVLRQLHLPEVVSGLADRLAKTKDLTLQQGLLVALVRLVNQEGVWDGKSWGTRPDTRGPYFTIGSWSGTPQVQKILTDYLATADAATKEFATKQMKRHRVILANTPTEAHIIDPQWAIDQKSLATSMEKLAQMKDGDIGKLDVKVATEQALAILNANKADAKKGEQIFIQQGCIACHAVKKNDPPKGPNLFDIAQRYKPEELIASIINPSAVVSQGFPTHVITTKDGKTYSGFALKESSDSITIRNMAALTDVIPTSSIAKQQKDERVSSMTPGLMNNVPPQGLADLVEYFKSIK